MKNETEKSYLVSPLDAKPYSSGFEVAALLQSFVDRVIPAWVMDAEEVGVWACRLNIVRESSIW